MVPLLNRILLPILILTYSTSAQQNLRQSSERTLYSGGATGGTENSVCIQQAFGTKPLTCTFDISIVRAFDVVILDDGCKFPGDKVRFNATFEIKATTTARYDVGIWFSTDGDPNNDGSRVGSCTAATPFIDTDNDACGDIPSKQPYQYPRFQLEAVCRGNEAGKLMLPYCITSRVHHENFVCLSASKAIPHTEKSCTCDKLFNVNITVPRSDGTGSGIGDPHFERYGKCAPDEYTTMHPLTLTLLNILFCSWAGHKFEYHGICDLVVLHSASYGNDLGLTIHARTAEKNGTSYITAAVVKIGNDKLEIQEDGTYYWNDEITAKLPEVFGDCALTYVVADGWLPMWTITSPRGGTIFLQIFDTMVDVKFSGFLNEAMSNSVGLLGDMDSGFLLSRNGDWMFNTNEFGNEWQVRDTEPMLFHESKQPQFPLTCSLPKREDVERRLQSLGHISDDEARELCNDSGKYFDSCVDDIRLFGNRETGKYYAFLANIDHFKR